MSTFDGKLVSAEWGIVLREAREDGVRFRLNSGRRTMAAQRALYNAWVRFRRVLAAFPNRNAPHIREGRPDHAIDVDALDGGSRRLWNWLRAQGTHPAFTVPREPWHIELPRRELEALARRFRDSLRELMPTERRWCREYDKLKRAGRNIARRRSLRKAMTLQRKRIWRAAQKDGWSKANRRARYAALMARTT